MRFFIIFKFKFWTNSVYFLKNKQVDSKVYNLPKSWLMYNTNNEFGAIPSNQRRKNNLRMRNRKRSNSSAGLDSGRFSEVSDIPTKNVSRFIEPRGSYGLNTLDALTS